jgi:hypothetical protein
MKKQGNMTPQNLCSLVTDAKDTTVDEVPDEKLKRMTFKKLN